MNFQKEVIQKLGSENVEKVLQDIRQGRINHDRLQLLAYEMHPNVNGVFSRESRKPDSELEFVFRRMLDEWWNECLCTKSEEEARMELVLALQRVRLTSLASNIKTNIGPVDFRR